MNREIKFRAWDQEYKRMVYDLRLSQLSFYGDDLNYALSQTELMQFTGLKDKNGKEIYEGDIVSFKTIKGTFRSQSESGIGSVEWDSEDTGFYILSNSEFFPYVKTYYAENLEVIGNIYENPELSKPITP